MYFPTTAGLFALASFVLPSVLASPAIHPPKYPYGGGGGGGSHGCSYAKKRAAVQAELKTIASHSAADAAAIPLDPNASRTFYLTYVIPLSHNMPLDPLDR